MCCQAICHYLYEVIQRNRRQMWKNAMQRLSAQEYVNSLATIEFNSVDCLIQKLRVRIASFKIDSFKKHSLILATKI